MSNELESLSTVVPSGDRRRSLDVMCNRLAEEADETRWATHKNICHCECGIGDGRVLVAVLKELRSAMAERDSLPASKEVSELDELRNRRADRLSKASGT